MTRRFRLLSLVSAFVLSFGVGFTVFAPPASAQVELCGLNDTIQIGGGEQIVMNNVWGAQTTQCIDVDPATGNFAITRSDHNNPGGQVASYPVIFEGCHWDFCTGSTDLPLPVNDTQTALSSWTSATGNVDGGTWNAAYDLWYHTNSNTARAPDGAELMIWLDRGGGAGPAGSQVASGVPIAGASWDLYFAEFTDWNYIAYIRTSPTGSVSNLDINAFTQDAVGRGFIQPSWYLSAVEVGFELWRQGSGLASSGFSFTGQAGGGSTTPPPQQGGCQAIYQLAGEWPGGFQGQATVTNNGTGTSNGWQVTLDFPDGQQISQMWGGVGIPPFPGDPVRIGNAPWNGAISPGGSTTVGFLGSHSGANRPPTTSCTFS
jgi:hypothetical protein